MTAKIIFSPFSYLVATLLFSGLFWLIAILTKKDFTHYPTIIFYILGGLGPAVVSIIFVYLNSEIDKKEFWNKIYSINRVGLTWLAIIIILVLAASLIAIAWSYYFKFDDSSFENVKKIFSNPVLFISTLLFNLIAVVLEEIGWRGYALDQLQTNFSALSSSLILGLFWAVWHFPLFFVYGTYQNQIGIQDYKLWLFMSNIIVQSIIITWVYNNTSRSVLAAIILHFLVNFSGELFKLGEKSEIVRSGIFFLYSLLIIFVFGYSTFTR